jgi:hypothetical protein
LAHCSDVKPLRGFPPVTTTLSVMKKIIVTLVFLIPSLVQAGAWDCNDQDKISDKLELSFSPHSEKHSFVDDPDKTLTALVIKIPKVVGSYNFIAITVLTSKKPRYDFTLLSTDGSWGSFEAAEKSKQFKFTRIVADKSFFNGHNCVIAQYKTATGDIQVEYVPLTLNKSINVKAQQAEPDALLARPL